MASAAVIARSQHGANVSEVELMRTILGEHVPEDVIQMCLRMHGADVTAALNWYFTEIAPQLEDESTAIGAAAATAATATRLGPGTASAVSVTSVTASGVPSQHDTSTAPVVHSGLSLTVHARNPLGMMSKTDAYYATLTQGSEVYDMLTPSNEKFMTIRLRKRSARPRAPSFFSKSTSSANTMAMMDTSAMTVQRLRSSFMNGDIVTLECNGLWLRANSLYNKNLQWKSPTDDDRFKFVIRGLPLGRSLRPGDYFFLMSYRYGDKEIVTKDERPASSTSYNTSQHRCFLGLDRIKSPSQRLYFYVRLTKNAKESLPKPNDAVDMRLLSISLAESRFPSSRMSPARLSMLSPVPASSPSVVSTPQAQPKSYQRPLRHESSIDDMDTRIEQMAGIVGSDVPREQLSNYLRGADGNVEIALEHFFMSTPTSDAEVAAPQTSELAYQVTEPRGQRSLSHPRPPMSQLIIPIPSPEEPLMSPIPLRQPVQLPPAPLSSTMVQPPRSTPVQISQTPSIEDIQNSIERLSLSSDMQIAASEGLTIQDFEMVSVLGKGSFGAVMLVRFKKDGRVFALKIIKKTNMDKSDIRNAMEERQILQRIHHPYVCSLVFAFQTNERLYLGMKYYAAGDLFYHLNMRGRLPIRDAQLYAAELVLAISYLHRLNILYRDLKPSNIMLDAEGHVGLVDFGLSKQRILNIADGVKTLSGTAEYVAPEALTRLADGSRSYGKAYDWWSLGVVIYEMLVGESPFYDKNEHMMLRKIAYSDVVFPRDFPVTALDLVRGMLCKDPTRRLGIEQMGGVNAIKASPFFTNIDWSRLERREVPAYWKPKLSSETDTRYVDPEFTDEGPPSIVYDPSAHAKRAASARFSQFSFNINLSD